MTKTQQTVLDTIISTMETNLNVDFDKPNANAGSFRESAIMTAIEQNQYLIQKQLEEIAGIVKMKLPFIQELQQIGTILESRLAECRREGERPTIPIEKRSPKAR